MNISHEVLLRFCRECFEKVGMSAADATLTADNLVFASLRGVDSHGIIRLRNYVDRMLAGGCDPKAKPTLVTEGPTHVVLDAHNGAGAVAATDAMKRVIAKARESGMAFGGVRNSNHYGAAAYYSMMALEHGMIGISITNATPTMAPTGGKKGILGNNPICVAVPTNRHPALVLDMASGQVAKGKILLAHQDGRKIPLTWALDEHGHPTDDPAVALKGLVQPLGGYKGYGIALILDVLSGVLMGSAFGPLVGQMYGPAELPCGVAHSCMAIRVECFMPLDEFRNRMDELIDHMHACALADGADRVMVAGEPEVEYERERRAKGIPVSPVLAAELQAIAHELHLQPPC